MQKSTIGNGKFGHAGENTQQNLDFLCMIYYWKIQSFVIFVIFADFIDT